MEKNVTFNDLGLSESTLNALKKRGFENPTPIQAQTIPLLLNGTNDVIGQAQTGTGKTAAFGLPIIEMLESKTKSIQTLILTPTRELCIQVAEEINSLKGKKNIVILPIYGGQSIEQQFKRLKKKVDVLVGTPGRVLDHIKRKTISFKEISFLVLDEADEMLNIGFIDEVKAILDVTNKERKTLLFSATMPSEVLSIAKKYMNEYDIVKIKKDQLTTHLTDQIYFEVSSSDKFEALCRIVDVEIDFYGLIFCRTKRDVDEISNRLVDRGYESEALHGDISQSQREKILKKFKNKRCTILVATDVAARGIDINDLTHVINYSLPQDPESYIHRIGRTGRAGKEGTAITFVTPSEYRKLLFIKRIAKTDIRKEKLPKVKDIIKIKKARIKDDLNQIIEGNDYNDYEEITNDLLNNHAPENIISALLKYKFQEELSEENYYEIQDVKVDNKGKTRLFVALGKKDGMLPRKLVEFIKKEAKIPERIIRDVKVYENFSFITVPFEEAEIILKAFKMRKRGRKPIIERAKENKKR